MHKIATLFCLSLLVGCAAHTTQEPMQLAKKQDPAKITVPELSNRYCLSDKQDPMLVKAFERYTKTGKASNIITDGFIQYAYSIGQQPIVSTAPFQETVISLEPGEKFTNITSGDPNRWSYAVAVSGTSNTQQQHVLVKPSEQSISTNMVITTDKRIYNLRLLSSQEKNLTRHVSFWYPEEWRHQLNVSQEKDNHDLLASGLNINPAQINFNYQIKNAWMNSPGWKPSRVFDDGTRTYIQFPEAIKHHDLPIVFVHTNHQQALVNFQVKSPYIVVNQLFKEAVLVKGVGVAKEKVTISNLGEK
jgi:type IV secretion system protein VirB9